MSTTNSPPPKYVLWPYTPSLAAGIISALVMSALFLFHTYKLFKHKTWFCIPFVIGALFESIGYSARAAAHNDTESTRPYIIQSTLILLAPILFAASVYMILGRMVRRTASTDYSVVRVTWVTKIFVGGDVLCFMIQGGGAGLLVSASTTSGFKRGENVILSGLVLQILLFGFFVVVAGVWHSRLRRQPTAEAATLKWEGLMGRLYAASGCIMLRNLFRVVEYGMGSEGYLITHEWPIYIFDFLLMVATLGVSVCWYGADIKPNGRKRDVEFSAVRT